MQTTYVRQTSERRSQFNGSDSPATPSTPRSGSGARPGRPRPATFKNRSGAGSDRGLVEALVNSRVFQDYERAFTEATGLPVAFRPVETWQLPHHGKRNEGPFCAIISEKSRACASCLSVQEKLSELAAEEPYSLGCPNGLSDTAVPVRLGDRLIGFLQTGQVFKKKPSASPFERVGRQVA